MNKVTVIIPNYNGLRFMEPCLEALKQQNFKEFDLLVVGNGSQVGRAEWLRKRGIPAIFLDSNTGFSGAVNTGTRAVSTPSVILLNNDTVPFPDYVGELVRCLDRFPEVFSASSKMIQLYHRDLMDDAGDMYSVLGWAYQRGVGQPSSGYQRACQVFAACAGAAIYRREVFEEIGYFDESHFAYLEDIDVGYRAKIHGYRNVYCPTAKIYHVGSGTSGSKYNSFKVRLAARNNVYLNYKNMPLLQLMLNAVPIGAGMAVKYAFFKKLGFGQDYRDGVREGFATLKNCKKVPYRPEHLRHYVQIQIELIWGTFLYVWEFGKRRLRKLGTGPASAEK